MSSAAEDLDSVRGHAWIRASLQRELALGRVAPTYLFAGPAGIGKRTVALGFLRAFLCLDPDADARACGRCASCRASARGVHPDLHVVAPEPAGSRLEIPVVRERVIEAFDLVPKLSLRSAVLIDGAEQITEEAQNALLKTLEEPPPGACLVLIARTETALLPTVLSRARLFRFGRPALEESIAVLAAELGGSEPPERLHAALELADGSPGAALELLSSDLFSETATFAGWIRDGAPSVSDLREYLPGLESGSEQKLAARREQLRELWRLALCVAGLELRRAHGIRAAGAMDSSAGGGGEADAASAALVEACRRWTELGLRALEDLESMVTPELAFELWAADLPRGLQQC